MKYLTFLFLKIDSKLINNLSFSFYETKDLGRYSLIFSIFCIFVTSCLGTWQLNRLSWKENLIKTFKATSSKPPINSSDDKSAKSFNFFIFF